MPFEPETVLELKQGDVYKLERNHKASRERERERAEHCDCVYQYIICILCHLYAVAIWAGELGSKSPLVMEVVLQRRRIARTC